MSELPLASADELWHKLVESHRAYSLACVDFLARKSERVAVLRQALRGRDRNTALTLTQVLITDERQQLFPEWVHLARCAHSPFEAAWKIILELPRDWVLTHIESEVDAILSHEEEDDYWMFLQLYEKLDHELAVKLARRAVRHSNADIRELGQDSLERLDKSPANGAHVS